jgi:hypothetical protein
MPTFDFTAPDGKSYSVEGPDGATPEQAFQVLQQQIGSVPKSEGSSIGGTAKSLGVGIAEGAIGLAGLPGDIYHLGLRALGDNLTPQSNYGSGSIKKGVESITGDFYKPQGEAEKLSNKVGQFLPAVLGGPESMALKLATRVAAPAVASEAGGAVGGPVGELAGALVGAGGATAAARKFQEMAAARRSAPALTADNVLETAGKQFNDARDMNLIVKPDFATNAAADMRSSVKSYDPEVIKSVHGAADRLEALATTSKGLPPTAVAMNDAENIRKQLVSLKTSQDASVRSAAKEAIKSLQQSQMGLTAADTISGDAGAYRSLIADAVGNWAKGKQAQIVMGKIGNAELNAATAGSGANQDNNLRQAMKQLARNTNNTNLPVWKKLGFSDDAGAAITQAAKGTILGNVARGIGKGAPTGVVSAAGGLGIGHMAGGPVGAVALPAIGYLAKKIGDLSTKKAANAITSLVLSESPLAAHVAARLPPQVISQMSSKGQLALQKLILADPILSQQAAQQQREQVSQPQAY